jgi:hypothetical protein
MEARCRGIVRGGETMSPWTAPANPVQLSANGHALPSQPDHLRVSRRLLAAVDNGMVQRRGQGIGGLPVPQQADVVPTPRGPM